eukprot:TRINITY_DN28389_c0_g1_i2.p1 TRINITY_DN28389_c0_g1~~TRINITY_DN28389_c0_g1_i2.p1  ORF type:complete len:683 (-),score=43.20 TRINITY_DN28389_c0_g1_i2:457-2436(-)
MLCQKLGRSNVQELFVACFSTAILKLQNYKAQSQNSQNKNQSVALPLKKEQKITKKGKQKEQVKKQEDQQFYFDKQQFQYDDSRGQQFPTSFQKIKSIDQSGLDMNSIKNYKVQNLKAKLWNLSNQFRINQNQKVFSQLQKFQQCEFMRFDVDEILNLFEFVQNKNSNEWDQFFECLFLINLNKFDDINNILYLIKQIQNYNINLPKFMKQLEFQIVRNLKSSTNESLIKKLFLIFNNQWSSQVNLFLQFFILAQIKYFQPNEIVQMLNFYSDYSFRNSEIVNNIWIQIKSLKTKKIGEKYQLNQQFITNGLQKKFIFDNFIKEKIIENIEKTCQKIDFENLVKILQFYKFFEFQIGVQLEQKIISVKLSTNLNATQICEFAHMLSEIQFYNSELYTQIQTRIFELKNQLNSDNFTKIVRIFARSNHADNNQFQQLTQLFIFLIHKKVNFSLSNFCVIIQQFSILDDSNSNEQFWIQISDYFGRNFQPQELTDLDFKNLYYSNLICKTKKLNNKIFQNLPRQTKSRAHDLWVQDQNEIITISQFQIEVYQYFKQLNLNPQLEYRIYGWTMSLDICLLKYKIAVEVDGRTHFRSDGKLTGSSACRDQMLQKMGWHVLNIPYFEWENLTTQIQKFKYLKDKIVQTQFNSPVGDQIEVKQSA